MNNSSLNNPNLIESYSSGASWYRVYSDGWCEQGGVVLASSSNADYTVNLLKTFRDTNYDVQTSYTQGASPSSSLTYRQVSHHNMTQTSFEVFLYNNTQLSSCNWRACGYIS